MNRIYAMVLLLTLFMPAEAQKMITLQQCYDSASVATPLAGERQLYGTLRELRDRNLAAGWLPSLDLTGSLQYNSDIPDLSSMLSLLPIPAGSMPEIPHEQYRAVVDVNQVIWDGGMTRSAREVEKVIEELNLKQNEADIYRLRDQVNSYYFSILLIRCQEEATEMLVADIDARLREIASAVENGVLLRTNYDVLLAEKIRAGQALTELRRRDEALLVSLEEITGIDDLSAAVLSLPEVMVTGGEAIDNPDIQLFDIRKQQIDASVALLKRQRMPRAFGFAQAGYGLPPGMNYFSESADFYYALGLGLKWNIFDWKKNSNERAALTVQKELIDIKKSATTESLGRLLTLKMAEITSLREASGQDEELITLRKNIAAAAASQMENGIITASQYLTELTAEKQAVVNAAVRRINIARAEAEYLNITGN